MASHLAEPPHAFGGFPEFVLPPHTNLWLVHPVGRWPWICSSGDDARFSLDEPWGTCHFALEPVGALVESCCRDEPAIDAATARAHQVSRLATEDPLRLADVASPRAYGFGVTAEIHSTPDYALTQRWAAAARSAGFAGVHYLLRHDPSQRLAAVALFGPAGERREWPPPQTRPLGAGLLQEAALRLGVAVDPVGWEEAG